VPKPNHPATATSPNTLTSSLSRRTFVRSSAMAATALTLPRLHAQPPARGPHFEEFSLDRNWLFGGSADKRLPLASAPRVNLPHCPVTLSWQDWNPELWQKVWLYRRTFASPIPPGEARRAFLHFDAVMTRALVSFNAVQLPEHLGGFLPFDFEVTSLMAPANTLELGVDGRWQNIPPGGSPKGPPACDYLMPAGITRSVSLRLLPPVFIKDVFAKPRNVLTPQRDLHLTCTLDAKAAFAGAYILRASVLDGDRELAQQQTSVQIPAEGVIPASVLVTGLDAAALWSPESPQLYNVHVDLLRDGQLVHQARTRTGFRDAKFTVDGFRLNGKPYRFFGLNRHELFPYVGFSMAARVMRHDAAMLKHELNVNSVRCSHYPQTEAFLDACDELGLMVWQETPGWQFLGDDKWRALCEQNVHDMIVRDRNHPSIVIWGARVNESANDIPLYTRTNAIARALDDSRPVSGTMTHYSTNNWIEDVFAYDDYHQEPDGSVGIRDPLPGVPYLVTEAIGQRWYREGEPGFGEIYRRSASRDILQAQAINHAQGHDRAARSSRDSGVLAWCAFEYASLTNGYRALKCPGVVDTFRIPKLGATFYQSQLSPSIRPVIAPNFYWDFGDAQKSGPGKAAAIFSNCDRLRVTVGDSAPQQLLPDRKNYPNLAYAPFFIDLKLDGAPQPELKIEGYVANHLVLTRTLSSNRSHDQLSIAADDPSIRGDGVDATRIAFLSVDKYGAPTPATDGHFTVHLSGPALLLGDTSFNLAETVGVGAVWVRATATSGTITLTVNHPRLGSASTTVAIQPPPPSNSI
jgi:beta-galactosidase